jgi:hypothetical protein
MVNCNFCGKLYRADGQCLINHKKSCPKNPNATRHTKKCNLKSDLNTAFSLDDDGDLNENCVSVTSYEDNFNDVVLQFKEKFVITLLNINHLEHKMSLVANLLHAQNIDIFVIASITLLV